MTGAEPQATGDKVADALETIRAEYGDSYDEWLRFANDATEHAREQGLDVDFFPPGVHMPIVRYQRTDADQVRRTQEITNEHLTALASFAGEL